MIQIAFDPIYELSLPANHRFPMEKYGLLPRQLLLEGTVGESNFFVPERPQDDVFLAIHDPHYYRDFCALDLDRKAERQIGFPLSGNLVYRERLIAGGTVMAAKYALQNGIGMNISGGTHHAYTDHGEGFCMLNDQAIAARYLQNRGLAKQVLIVDLDVHQGNGTAEIFEGDDTVFTFSMHGGKNYPFKKETSDLDIEFDDGTTDDPYLKTLKKTLPGLIREVRPDFVFFQSGVDILATDKLGRLNCTIAGCRERDRFVLETLKAYDVPVEVSMGGGYSKEIKHIIEAHANTYRVAEDLFG